MRLSILLITILILTSVSALCEEDQLDVNSASAEELDEIVYIGPARAEQIIVLRPFDSVDDLIRVSGIGEIYLNAIKEQGLACVDEEISEEVETETEPVEEAEEIDETPPETSEKVKEVVTEILETSEEKTELETIVLNPKVIKTDNSKENLNKNYALYGFVAFCVLMVVLFIIKRNRYKNEFR
jgi:hypothetical protein